MILLGGVVNPSVSFADSSLEVNCPKGKRNRPGPLHKGALSAPAPVHQMKNRPMIVIIGRFNRFMSTRLTVVWFSTVSAFYKPDAADEQTYQIVQNNALGLQN